MLTNLGNVVPNRAVKIADIDDDDLKKVATQIDRSNGGNADGVITAGEVERALDVIVTDPRLSDDLELTGQALKLKFFVEAQGQNPASVGARADVARPGASPLATLLAERGAAS